MSELDPKCLKENGEWGNTSQGYLLPCCWWDVPELWDDPEMRKLVQEKFKLTNIESIEQVIHSKEWTTFYDNLRKNIAPKYCYQHCGKSNI